MDVNLKMKWRDRASKKLERQQNLLFEQRNCTERTSENELQNAIAAEGNSQQLGTPCKHCIEF